MIYHRYGKASKSRMKGVYDPLIECAIMTLKESKYDITIPWAGGLRTAKIQYQIFKNGNSKCDGYEVKSYHQKSKKTGKAMALDLLVYVKGKTTNQLYKMKREQNYIARLFMKNWQMLVSKYAKLGRWIGSLTWGGTFGVNGWDRWHFQVEL